MARSGELLAKFHMVVDFAVESDGEPAAIALHGLGAAIDVDDGQSGVGESDRAQRDRAVRVRTPVRQLRTHAPREFRRNPRTPKIGDASDSAHTNS